MKPIVLEKQLVGGRGQRLALFHTQTPTQTAGGDVANHTLNRNHVQFFYQGFGGRQQPFEMSRHARCFQLFHDERIEPVVHHALAVQLFLFFAIKGGGIITEYHHEPFRVVSTVDGFRLAGIEFFTFFHQESPKSGRIRWPLSESV